MWHDKVAATDDTPLRRVGGSAADSHSDHGEVNDISGPKFRSISDFRMLQPATFVSTEKSLDAEQWLVDMTNLLNAARWSRSS